MIPVIQPSSFGWLRNEKQPLGLLLRCQSISDEPQAVCKAIIEPHVCISLSLLNECAYAIFSGAVGRVVYAIDKTHAICQIVVAKLKIDYTLNGVVLFKMII
jgi:hypothetical protein